MMTEQDIVGGLCTVVPGVAMLSCGGFTLVRGLWSKWWPTANGKIISISYSTNRPYKTEAAFVPEASFEYEVNGKTYTSTRVVFGGTHFGSEGKALDFVQRFSGRESVPVYYNPANPSTSVLIPGITRGSCVAVAFGAMLVGIFVAIVT